MKRANRRIFKDSLIVTLINILGQICGFVFTMLVARKFGAGLAADAYYLAIVIPVTFVGIASGLLRVVFVPFLVEERIKNPERIQNLLGSIISFMLIVSCICAVILAMLSYFNILELGQGHEVKALTRILLLELILLIPLTIMTEFLFAIYNAYQKFALAEFANTLRYIIVIPFIVFVTEIIGIHALAIGHVIGQFIAFLLAAWIVYRQLGIGLKLRFDFDSAFKRILRLSIVPFVSYAIALFTPLISILTASYLAKGSVSIYSYAQKLAIIPTLVVGTGFLGVLVSHWSKYDSESDNKQFETSLNRSVSILITYLIPIVVLLYLLKEPLIQLLLQRGEFSEDAVLKTAEVFSFLAIAVLPTYLNMVIVRVLYIKKDMMSIFWLSSLRIVLHLLMCYFLAIVLLQGTVGIALSYLISISLVAVITFVIVHNNYMHFSMSMLGINTFKSLIGCLLMFICIYLFKAIGNALIVKSGLIVEILGISIIGALIYLIALKLVRHSDIVVVTEAVLNLRKKKSNLAA